MSVQEIKIEIVIDKQGNVAYKVKGFKGKACVKSTEFLDEALGAVVKREHTREYYESEVKTTNRIETTR